MEEQTKETEVRLQDLWSVFKHCWWQCAIALILVAVLVYTALSMTRQDAYTATTSFYVLTPLNTGSSNTNVSSSDIYSVQLSNYLIKDCKVLIRTNKVLDPVVQYLDDQKGITTTVNNINSMIRISQEEDARVLYLSITCPNAELSAVIANEIADEACDYFNGEHMYNTELLSVIDYAQTPKNPSNPVSMLTVLLVAFVAAVIVYVIHFLRFILDDKINSAEDVEKYLGLSMLGVIPNRNDVGRKKSKYGYYYSRRDPDSQKTQEQ